MKKFVCGLLVGILLSVSIVSFAATEQFTALKATFPIFVNGSAWQTDKPVVVIDGSAYLPLKALGDVLGVNVAWDAAQKRVVVGEVPADNSENDKYITAGMYKVGQDIKAGEYVVYPDGQGYYQVSRDSTGEPESIIANDSFSGNRYVTVADGQYFELKNAKMLPIAETEPFKPVSGKYTGGMYKVGRDIEAGEYKAIAEDDFAYAEIVKDSTGSFDSIITNDNFTASKYVTIKDGQYIKLVNCYLEAE